MNAFLTALKMFLFMTVLTGVVYPLLITLVAFVFVNEKSSGGFLTKDSKVIGAKLIGQKFESERYFHSRPSANGYNALNSGGSNLGPTSLLLRNQVKERQGALKNAQANKDIPLPIELLFASGSGLDPHISKDAAYFQIERIVKARKLDPVVGGKKIRELIDSSHHPAWISHLSRPYINVLMLNMSLDTLLDHQK